jgi:hypothetical protein
VATSLNHRAGAVHLYACDAEKITFSLKEVLVFPSTALSRHTGDDPIIRSIAWAPNGKYLALNVHSGDLTDYVTLASLSHLGPPTPPLNFRLPLARLPFRQ